MISRRTLGVAVIAVLPLVAGCGAGRSTTTDKERQTPYVATVSAGSILVTAATLVPSQAASSGSSSTTPEPTPSASSDTTGGSGASADGYLVVTLANRGTQPERLTGVTLDGGSVAPGSAVDQTSGLTVQPQQSLRFGDPELGDSGATLEVSGLSQPLTPGTAVKVTFTFQDAGSATLEVPVRASDEYGTTATSTPLPLTGSYPSASETAESEPSAH